MEYFTPQEAGMRMGKSLYPRVISDALPFLTGWTHQYASEILCIGQPIAFPSPFS